MNRDYILFQRIHEVDCDLYLVYIYHFSEKNAVKFGNVKPKVDDKNRKSRTQSTKRRK